MKAYASASSAKVRAGGGDTLRASRRAASVSRPSPSPESAQIGITGIPRRAERRRQSSDKPRFLSVSVMFTARIMPLPSESRFSVRKRLRSRDAASAMLMITSHSSPAMNSRAAFSSARGERMSYIPGRSHIAAVKPSPRKSPSRRSTVTPGQFPVRIRPPVSALNSVVLPQFGFPASAAEKSAVLPASGLRMPRHPVPPHRRLRQSAHRELFIFSDLLRRTCAVLLPLPAGAGACRGMMRRRTVRRTEGMPGEGIRRRRGVRRSQCATTGRKFPQCRRGFSAGERSPTPGRCRRRRASFSHSCRMIRRLPCTFFRGSRFLRS